MNQIGQFTVICEYDITIDYRKRGTRKAKRGDHEGAIVDFNRALAINPDDPEAYHNRGVSKHALGNQEGAFQDFMSSIQFKQLQASLCTFSNTLRF